MAVRVTRPEPPIPATIERIHRHRQARLPASPSKVALAAVREVVRRSRSTLDAIAAVKAISTAWSDVSPATRDAVELLLAILELSDSVDKALATYTMLRSDGTLLKPLRDIQRFVQAEFPGARMRIVPGDEVASAYLDAFIPAEDYPSFWTAHLRLQDWMLEQFPHLDGVIHTTPLPAPADV